MDERTYVCMFVLVCASAQVPDRRLALVRVDSMDSADSSPMTTPALSEASTPRRSREGDALPVAHVRRGARTPPRLLSSAGSDGASRTQAAVKAAGAVLALEVRRRGGVGCAREAQPMPTKVEPAAGRQLPKRTLIFGPDQSVRLSLCELNRR